MEKVNLSLFTAQQLQTYLDEHSLGCDEQQIAGELSAHIAASDVAQLGFFRQFGECFHKIIRNVHSYRHGLEYGFTAIEFNQYGWLKRALFLDQEEFAFGDAKRLHCESKLEIGRGPNGKWTYGLWCSYGTAGSVNGLSVYAPPLPSRQAAIDAGLADLKAKFSKVLGNPDTMNYRQAVIVKTLADIVAFQHSQVQLTLF
ncbi:hypothetical protein [Pedobacter sp.]